MCDITTVVEIKPYYLIYYNTNSLKNQYFSEIYIAFCTKEKSNKFYTFDK